MLGLGSKAIHSLRTGLSERFFPNVSQFTLNKAWHYASTQQGTLRSLPQNPIRDKPLGCECLYYHYEETAHIQTKKITQVEEQL